MTTWFITRHSGAVDWARAQGIGARHVEHLDLDSIRAGDIVLGTLPVSLAARVCALGSEYHHLTLDLPPDWRGRELSAQDMDRFGARLQRFHIEER